MLIRSVIEALAKIVNSCWSRAMAAVSPVDTTNSGSLSTSPGDGLTEQENSTRTGGLGRDELGGGDWISGDDSGSERVGESGKPSKTDDGKSTDPETVEKPKDDNPGDTSERATDSGGSHHSGNRPSEHGGKRGKQPGNQEAKGPLIRSPRPELVCWENPASGRWEVFLTADEENLFTAVHHEGTSLGITDGRCSLPSLTGRLTICTRDGQKHILPLFEEGKPLIFKLPKNWTGEGRRTSAITSGHFIVIAPIKWQRTGHVPVEADGCADPEFQAHYFYRDLAVSDQDPGGFGDGAGCLAATGITLTGRDIYDDSNDGLLFVRDPPELECSNAIEWARVGEETKQGWGKNFRPDKESLSDVMDGREGRFFLRVYGQDRRMLDSVAFRYVRDLRQINVNGTKYVEDMVLMPGKKGYPLTKISLVGTKGSTRFPTLPPQAQQTIAPSCEILVPPCPDADHIAFRLGSGVDDTNIVLDLPRIWWRLENGSADPDPWRDTPFDMTREEFRNHAYADARLSILSKRHSSVRAGFDDRLDQPYSRKIKDSRIVIPMAYFADHAQIDGRLNEEANFCVEWAGEKLPLIRVAADRVPEILTFTSNPPSINAGQKTILKWTTRNTQGVRAFIEPAIGSVDSNGSLRIEPAASMQFTLRLEASDFDDMTRDVAVTVDKHGNSRDFMLPMEFNAKVEKMQCGDFLEYYRGHLGIDSQRNKMVKQLQTATQYWKEQGIIAFVQGRILKPRGSLYFAVRTSCEITQKCIEGARVLHVHRTP